MIADLQVIKKFKQNDVAFEHYFFWAKVRNSLNLTNALQLISVGPSVDLVVCNAKVNKS